MVFWLVGSFSFLIPEEPKIHRKKNYNKKKNNPKISAKNTI